MAKNENDAQCEYEEAELREEALKAVNDIELPKGESIDDDEAEKLASAIIKRAASLKAVKIDRDRFLRVELAKYCPEVDSEVAIAQSPIVAGVSPQVLDRIAVDAIDLEVKKCAGLSFLAGIPGGVAMVGTVPADLAQYFAHVMRVEQKLAYLYGWSSFLDENDEVDDETVMHLIVLMGVMLQVGGAANTITKFASQTAKIGAQKTIQKQALTKTIWYTPMKAVLRSIGVQMNKEIFAKTVSKAVPVIGGVVSGGLTYASFKPGAERLRKYLRSLPLSGIDPSEPDGATTNIVEDAINAAAPVVEGASAAIASAGKHAGSALSDGTKVAGGVVQDGARAASEGIGNAVRGVGSLLGSKRKK